MSFDLSSLPFSPMLVIFGLGYAVISTVATGPEIIRRENVISDWHERCQSEIQADIQATRRPDQLIPQVPDIGGMICSAYPELGNLCQFIPDPSAAAFGDPVTVSLTVPFSSRGRLLSECKPHGVQENMYCPLASTMAQMSRPPVDVTVPLISTREVVSTGLNSRLAPMRKSVFVTPGLGTASTDPPSRWLVVARLTKGEGFRTVATSLSPGIFNG